MSTSMCSYMTIKFLNCLKVPNKTIIKLYGKVTLNFMKLHLLGMLRKKGGDEKNPLYKCWVWLPRMYKAEGLSLRQALSCVKEGQHEPQ